MNEGNEAFTAEERAALASWRVPAPPQGFAARVSARARGGPPAGARGAALAAAVLVIVGGLFTARLLAPAAAPGPGLVAPPDGGPRPDGARDGVQGLARPPGPLLPPVPLALAA